MILAAGRGERMRPLTDSCPKPMLKAGGKPLIAWHLEALARAGFERVVINHAHLGHVIEAGLGDGRAWGLDICYSAETIALETAGGIAKALPLLGHQPFLVVNGDVFVEMDFAALARQLTAWRATRLAHLVLVPNPPHNPHGDFDLLSDGLVMDGVTASAVGASRWTFSGVGLYHPKLFEAVQSDRPAKLAPLLRHAMQSGQVSGEIYTGLWLDIGTPQRLNELNDRLNSKA